jgi:two-component system OmpR family response regulator
MVKEDTNMTVPAFLVEDNAVIRSNLIPTLAELGGVSVVAFAEGQSEALEWLQRHDGLWELVIVDLFLKEGSGLGVITACKERNPSSQVVVLTNYATGDMRRRCLELGADAFFDKSSQLEEFFAYCELHASS